MKLIKYFFILLLIIFPFGQLTRIPLGIPSVNVYLQDIVVTAFVMSWITWHIFKREKFKKALLQKPILMFIGTLIISLLVNFLRFKPTEIFVSSLYLIRFVFYAGIYFVASDLVLYRYIDISKIKLGLIMAGTTAAVFGLIQYFIFPDLASLAYLGWDVHKFRVFGTFLDPSFLGLILVLSLILFIDKLLRLPVNNFSRIKQSFLLRNQTARVSGFKRLLQKLDGLPATYIGLLIIYLALALTYSRSSYLAFLAGMGVIAFFRRSPKIFILSFLLILATLFLLPRPPGSEGVKLERENSVWGRFVNWQHTLTIFKDHPLFGVGFDTYRYVQKDYGYLDQENWQETHSGAGADSSLLFILATTGILGFGAYSYLIYKAYGTHKTNVTILASLGAVFIHSWFSNSLFYPWVMLWLFIMLSSKEGN